MIGIRYTGALKFGLNKWIDLAFSFNPYIGFMDSGYTPFWLGVDAPCRAEIYFGGMDRTSFFLGPGFTYYNVGFAPGNPNQGYFGPQLHGGVQIKVKNQIFGIRTGYVWGIVMQEETSGEVKKWLITGGLYYHLPVSVRGERN